jgi:hypothetical protein
MAVVHRKLHHRKTILQQILAKTGCHFSLFFGGYRQIEKYEKPHDMISI